MSSMAGLSNCPAEIKNAIYREILCNDSKSRERSCNELAIFTVSKQLHNESSSYFYENNTITIDIPSAPTATATTLPPIADRYLRFLRRLILHVPTGPATDLETPYIASAIEAVPSMGAELTELKLVLTSCLSHLLNSRVDDSVLDRTHPITKAIQSVLRDSGAKVVRIILKNAWFGAGVAQTLQHEFGSKVEFYQHDMLVQDVTAVERALVGRYASEHLINLGLGEEKTADLSHNRKSISNHSAPASLPSSLCSAFSNLDTFSVSSFKSGADDTEALGYDDPSKAATNDQPFFDEDDIEEWSAGTQDDFNTDEDGFEMDLDDELEDVPQDDVDAFMRNMDEVAHHKANEMDVEYLTNFAPELLLSRAQLSHLI